MEQIACSAGDRLLVFAPHPDDESLACGGLIQRAQQGGAVVFVVVATDGDANPWPQRLIEKRWRLGPDATRRWGALRGNEARAALQTLGVKQDNTRFLHWPDQGLTTLLMEQGEERVALLRDLIRQIRPTLVAMPSILDSHPDHSALAVLLKAALCAEGSVARPLSYWLHGRARAVTGVVSQVTLAPRELVVKRAAALSHASQACFGTSRLLRFVKASEEFRQPIATVPEVQTRWRWRFRSGGPFGIAAARQLHVVAISAAGHLHAASFDLRKAGGNACLKIKRRGFRTLEIETAPLWSGALWVVAKLGTAHHINVYDAFGWIASDDGQCRERQQTAAYPQPSSPDFCLQRVTTTAQQRNPDGSSRD